MCKKIGRIDYQNYDHVWKRILNRKKTYQNKTIFKSCFSAWDNSPRKGKKNSIILKGSSPRKFGDYVYKLFESNRVHSSDEMVVINAWNEWGEGAILEPSEQFKFQYLEELQRAKRKYERKI